MRTLLYKNPVRKNKGVVRNVRSPGREEVLIAGSWVNLSVKFFKTYGAQISGMGISLAISVLLFVYKDFLISTRGLGYFGIFATGLLGNATVFLPIPYIHVVVAASAVLSPTFVALSVSLGSALGELVAYFGGSSGRIIFSEKSKFKKIEAYMKKYGLWTIFFLALVPNFIFDIAGLIAGASGIPVRNFFAVAFAGKFVRYLIIAYMSYYSFGF